MLARLTEFLKEHIGKALLATGLGSALISAVATDFGGWRSSNREFMKHQLEVSEQADRELMPLVRKFSEKALGKNQTSESDLSTLRARVDNSYLVAKRIAERLPKTEGDFRPYAQSLIDLQKCAERFQGPADGQCWVEAVSAYAARKQAFETKIATVQTTWP